MSGDYKLSWEERFERWLDNSPHIVWPLLIAFGYLLGRFP